MTSNEKYTKLNPSGIGLYQKVLCAVVAVGLSAAIAYDVISDRLDAHWNRTEISVEKNPTTFEVQVKKWKDDKVAYAFDWTRHRECCKEVKYDGRNLCVHENGKVTYIRLDDVGVRLKINEIDGNPLRLQIHDFNCDKKTEKSYSHHKDGRTDCSKPKNANAAVCLNTDQNLVDAEDIINKEMDLKKEVEDWLNQ